MAYCLPKHLVNGFLKKLKSGEINPDTLLDMTSQQRRDFFSEFLGAENAKEVNTLLESKLILKNQQQGIINWAKQVAHLKPDAQKDLLSRINKMTEILEPEEEDAFLEDLVAKKLEVYITSEEASGIAELARIATIKKAKMEALPRRVLLGKPTAAEMEYGHATVNLANYINDLKIASELSFKEKIIEGSKKPFAVGIPYAFKYIGGLAKSIVASVDNSALGRQGLKVLLTHPKIWARNSLQSFVDFVRAAGGKEVKNEVNAEIISRPTYDKMVKAKLAVGTIEEAFPSSVPERIPILGRVFKGSEAAYTGFLHRTRADVFDRMLEIAETMGEDINDKEFLTGLGALINALTGRAHLGSLEPIGGFINNFLFSGRLLRANLDFLTAHVFDAKVTGFAQKRAVRNLVQTIVGIGAFLALFNALDDEAVELDPRSSDFGKIKIGNTRFDITGSMSSFITLAARVALSSTKSGTTGQIYETNTGKFGAQKTTDIVFDFFQNKASPLTRVVMDFADEQTFTGEKPTFLAEVLTLVTPLQIANSIELLKSDNAAPFLVAFLADFVGIGTNTYAKKKKQPVMQIKKKGVLERATDYLKSLGGSGESGESTTQTPQDESNISFEEWKKRNR